MTSHEHPFDKQTTRRRTYYSVTKRSDHLVRRVEIRDGFPDSLQHDPNMAPVVLWTSCRAATGRYSSVAEDIGRREPELVDLVLIEVVHRSGEGSVVHSAGGTAVSKQLFRLAQAEVIAMRELGNVGKRECSVFRRRIHSWRHTTCRPSRSRSACRIRARTYTTRVQSLWDLSCHGAPGRRTSTSGRSYWRA